MIGLRLRDLTGSHHELAVSNGLFADPTGPIEEWIDMREGYAIVGLVDAHAHLTGASVQTLVDGTGNTPREVSLRVRQHLGGGVLLVADKGGRDNSILGALAIPASQRPELSLAGSIVSVEDGYYPGFGLVVDQEESVEDWIEAVCPPGISWLKVVGDWPRRGQGPVANFSEKTLRTIVTAAHARGLRVAIHSTAPGAASDAVAAGIDSIEHGLFLTEDDLRDLGARGGAWVPTIAAMEGIRDLLGGESSGGRLFAEGLDNLRSLIGSAPGWGVRVLAGTDLHLPHGGVATEALRLHEYGLEASEAVAAVTTAGYEYLSSARSLAPGDGANVVVLAGDPREDLAALLNPLFVMRAGVIVSRESR